MKYFKIFEEYYKKNIPTELYHTSNFLFDKFELKSGYRTHLVSSEKVDSYAIYLTDDLSASKEYGENYTYVCEINCNRVLDWSSYIDDRSYSWITSNFGEIIPHNSDEYWTLLDDKRVIDYLNNRGIDCVVFTEFSEATNDTFTAYAVFNPNNIKIINVIKID